MENHKVRAVSEILTFRHTTTKIDILLLLYMNMFSDVIEFLFLAKSTDQEDDIQVEADQNEKTGDDNNEDQVEIFMWQV